ncbi:hypothetical protein PROPEN_03460 [Proteus penneri ATCC 35198]|nr:hypothetical protein PROPEN_03460 [Proteus penneri ATCC 35198]
MSNGGVIKPGMLFRSGSLDRLTNTDQSLLIDKNLFKSLIIVIVGKSLINQTVSGKARNIIMLLQTHYPKKFLQTLKS